MRAVEYPDFALAEWGDVGRDHDGIICHAERQPLTECLVPLDDPEGIKLGVDGERVVKAELLFEDARIRMSARHDAINQRVAKGARVLYPINESRAQRPLPGERQHQIAESIAVVLDELATKHDDAAVRTKVESDSPLVQQRRELGGKRKWRIGIESIGRIQADPHLGGVGDHILEVGAARHAEDIRPMGSGRKGAADGAHDAAAVDDLSILDPLDAHRKQSVLLVEKLCALASRRRHGHGPPRKVSLAIRLIDDGIHKPAQERARAELQDALRKFGMTRNRRIDTRGVDRSSAAKAVYG